MMSIRYVNDGKHQNKETDMAHKLAPDETMTQAEKLPLYKIKSGLTGLMLFGGRFGSLRLCVEAAVSKKISLNGANLSYARLNGASLDGARLHGARLDGANLKCANLDGANLHGARLHGANLNGANLKCANLKCANLDGANLDGANLNGANLNGANLSYARLHGANLEVANLYGANLSYARLDGANLNGARLDGANLNGANLKCAHDIIMLGHPNGWIAYAYRTTTGIRVQIGCQNKTIPEGREYWAGKDNRREVMAALDCAEKIAALRGWTFVTEE